MGKIEKIIPRTRNDAHRLIEECMLAANVCAADLLIRHKHPGTFRIHATPTEEKLNQLRTFLKMTGLNLGGGMKPSAGDYAALMREIKERPDAALLQTMLLRSMQQAVYSPDNVGHFGLAYEAYAHFTSPIRRYPDLLTHRAIKAVLAGKKYEPKGIDLSKLNTNVSNATRKQAAKDKAEGKAKDAKDLTIWDALGVHCSANERRADEASRDVENWLKCYFMQDKLGESFTGIVAGVTTFGIFVQLDELYVEGLVHVTGLGEDYFQYDEARHQLRGERTGKTFGLTDRVTVQVAKVDLEARKIDLVLAQDGNAERRRCSNASRAFRAAAAASKSDRNRGANAQPAAAGSTRAAPGLQCASRRRQGQPLEAFAPLDARSARRSTRTGGSCRSRQQPQSQPQPQFNGNASRRQRRYEAFARSRKERAAAREPMVEEPARLVIEQPPVQLADIGQETRVQACSAVRRKEQEAAAEVSCQGRPPVPSRCKPPQPVRDRRRQACTPSAQGAAVDMAQRPQPVACRRSTARQASAQSQGGCRSAGSRRHLSPRPSPGRTEACAPRQGSRAGSSARSVAEAPAKPRRARPPRRAQRSESAAAQAPAAKRASPKRASPQATAKTAAAKTSSKKRKVTHEE
jgi:ribonuclease R